VKCEDYTVHFKNDKYCENPMCPSNTGVKNSHLQKQPSRKPGAAYAGKSTQLKSGVDATGRPSYKKQCDVCSTSISKSDS